MTPERAAIERQLDAILASEDFASAPKMRALLRYLVEATLAGDADRLKGYAIGVDVFERGAAFDPATDPIVRVQAGRLRKLLDAYYLTAGQNDAIRLDIPKGGYAVEWRAHSGVPSEEKAPSRLVIEGSNAISRASPSGRYSLVLLCAASVLAVLLVLASRLFLDDSARNAPKALPPLVEVSPDALTLAVLPFTNMSQDASNASFADGLADALTTALARVKSISVASRTSAFQYRKAADLRAVGRELGVRYILEGGLQRDGEHMRINVQLIDALTGAHLWAQDYNRIGRNELAVQDELVMTLAAEIRPQLFNAYKRALETRPAQPATAWQLYMQSTWMPGGARNSLAWEKDRVALARRALEIDPNLGQADSVLADKLAYLANVDPPSDTEEARAEAAEHARRALDLAPGDADAIFNVSNYHWHAGHISEAAAATQRTLELDPNHVLARFLVKAVPYGCSAAPQSIIDDLIAFDTGLSSNNPVRSVTLTWISLLYLNNGDFVHAAAAGRRSEQMFPAPNTVYRLAASLVQLGERKAAVDLIDQQRGRWPNLDLRHYADVVIPRRCGNAPKAYYLYRVYSELADAVKATRRENATPTSAISR
jgi:TolB-like protein